MNEFDKSENLDLSNNDIKSDKEPVTHGVVYTPNDDKTEPITEPTPT